MAHRLRQAYTRASSSTLDDFEVIKELASGQFGIVYKVRRRHDNCVYALKKVLIKDETTLQSAVQETLLMMSFSNENLVDCYDCFVEGNAFFVVMEYAPYKDLRYYISKAQRIQKPFPEIIVWKVLLQLARGLCELHRRNVIHRDVKAENIVLFPRDIVKITDLGVARVIRDAESVTTCVGTLLTMSPQVLDKQPYDTKSDMWSLGCVIYEMLTLEPPFGGGFAAVQRIMAGDYKPIPAQLKYSPELVAFVNALLSVDPRLRPSASQIIQTAPNTWWRSLPEAPSSRRLSVSESGAGQGNDVLGAIPDDLQLLFEALPKAKYPSGLPPTGGSNAVQQLPHQAGRVMRDKGRSECGAWVAGVPRPFREASE